MDDVIYQSGCVLYSSPLEDEVECEEGEEPAPLPSSCDATCRLMGNERNNESNTCFGTTEGTYCGIENYKRIIEYM